MYFIGNYVFSNCCKALKISMKVGLKKINKYTFPPKRDHGFLSFSREAGADPDPNRGFRLDLLQK